MAFRQQQKRQFDSGTPPCENGVADCLGAAHEIQIVVWFALHTFFCAWASDVPAGDKVLVSRNGRLIVAARDVCAIVSTHTLLAACDHSIWAGGDRSSFCCSRSMMLCGMLSFQVAIYISVW